MTLVLLILSVLAGAAGCQEVAPAPSVDDERAANRRAYEAAIDALRREHDGQWVVIAQGRVAATASKREEVLGAAPDAKHRYVFDVGSEGDREVRASEWYGPRFARGLGALGLSGSFGPEGASFEKGGRRFGPVGVPPFSRVPLVISAPASDGPSSAGRTWDVFIGTLGPPLMLMPEDWDALGPAHRILQTASEESRRPGRPGGIGIRQTPSEVSAPTRIVARFPLPWSAYVRLLSVRSGDARAFYETEALRGGWSVRQLDRQVESQFYERTALSHNKVAMLRKGARSRLKDVVTPETEVKDPYVLEFLGLKDEYSETVLEDALIRHLEEFLLELGGDFCFVARQKRLRIGDEWFRVDLVLFHRRLRCLVVIDLKLGRFTHADAGQMHTYLNYATAHWTRPGENPPVGLILCTRRDEALARYALGNLPKKVLAAEYRTILPDVRILAADLDQARRSMERRGISTKPKRGNRRRQ